MFWEKKQNISDDASYFLGVIRLRDVSEIVQRQIRHSQTTTRRISAFRVVSNWAFPVLSFPCDVKRKRIQVENNAPAQARRKNRVIAFGLWIIPEKSDVSAFWRIAFWQLVDVELQSVSRTSASWMHCLRRRAFMPVRLPFRRRIHFHNLKVCHINLEKHFDASILFTNLNGLVKLKYTVQIVPKTNKEVHHWSTIFCSIWSWRLQ